MSANETGPPIPDLDRRTKSAVLWGAVGFMSFLVLVQAYALYDGPIVSIGQGVVLAALVGAVAGTSAYALEHRVAEWAARRERTRERES